MAASKYNDVALTVERWAHEIRNNNEIRAEVKLPGRLNELAVSNCHFDHSGSGVTHTEYLHLRTIWYRYRSNRHLDDFANVFRNNDQTGYKGFVSPQNHKLARELVSEENMSKYLKRYLEEGKTEVSAPAYLHPSPECGYFSMVRYWQVMATTHTKDGGTDGSKIYKPQAEEEARGRSTTPVGQQGPDGPSTVTTPPRQILPTSATPSNIKTPAATSHPAAKGGAGNPASADEAYVNVALLLMLQAVTQDFHKHFSALHWVPPRMALHLNVPVFNAAEQKFRNKLLLEARVDGYLCYGKAGFERPMAICEAKSATRKAIQMSTERQEAAEMAAWICNHPLDEGLLQSSNSGKKR